MNVAGKFISFEGGDGSGKSTQARVLAETLKSQGFEVIFTREPGGSAGAEEIRALILQGDVDRWSPETELLLFNAARRDHVERVIRPAMKRGAVVISDRFADSTRVYQGIARADLRDKADALHELMIGIEPDLTIVMEVDAETALNRALGRAGSEERFENMGLELQERIRDGFSDIAREFPDRIRLVDGAGDQDAVASRVSSVVATFFSQEKTPAAIF